MKQPYEMLYCKLENVVEEFVQGCVSFSIKNPQERYLHSLRNKHILCLEKFVC